MSTSVDKAAAAEPVVATRPVNPMLRALRRARRDPAAMAALVVLLIILAVAALSFVWTPYPPNKQALARPMSGPSSKHWLGVDDLGRDVVSRLMAGAGLSLRISIEVIAGALLIAVPYGLVSGYFGGFVDSVMMRILDAFTAVPGLVLAVAIAGVLGPGVNNLVIALTIVLIPAFARLVRAQAIAVAAEPYVTASKSVGSGTMYILAFRVLPGVLPALIVQVSLALGTVLVADASLSYLGLGVQPPSSSWGSMLRRAYTNIFINPVGVLPSAIAIALAVLAFNILGDGLRDALGVGTSRRLRKRARLGITSVHRDSVEPPSATASDIVLSVQDLHVAFDTPDRGRLEVLDGVTFDVKQGELVALVGESGSGKTVTALSIMRLLLTPPGVITDGHVIFDGKDLLDLPLKEMRKVRGAGISMIFQNPMSSLDPSFRVGSLLGEAIRAHNDMSRAAVRARSIELMDMVGIPDARRRLDSYPHQFSGGMRQRAMIAMALAAEPRLLIADEPTTALDVSIQAQILALLAELRRELGMAMILVTHDLGVVADLCDRVAVMYAGQIVEQAPIHELFAAPAHPYTAALLASVPTLTGGATRLTAIPGTVPPLHAMPSGCRFHTRCRHADSQCSAAPSALKVIGNDREVRCRKAAELELEGIA